MSLADRWAAFEAVIVNPDAHPALRASLKRAFYAGAGEVYFNVLMKARGPGDLEALQAELGQWMETLAQGEK